MYVLGTRLKYTIVDDISVFEHRLSSICVESHLVNPCILVIAWQEGTGAQSNMYISYAFS